MPPTQIVSVRSAKLAHPGADGGHGTGRGRLSRRVALLSALAAAASLGGCGGSQTVVDGPEIGSAAAPSEPATESGEASRGQAETEPSTTDALRSRMERRIGGPVDERDWPGDHFVGGEIADSLRAQNRSTYEWKLEQHREWADDRRAMFTIGGRSYEVTLSQGSRCTGGLKGTFAAPGGQLALLDLSPRRATDNTAQVFVSLPDGRVFAGDSEPVRGRKVEGVFYDNLTLIAFGEEAKASDLKARIEATSAAGDDGAARALEREWARAFNEFARDMGVWTWSCSSEG